jgi:heat shock protein HslJ
MMRAKVFAATALAFMAAVSVAGTAQAKGGKKQDPASEAEKARKAAEERYKPPKTFPTKITWTLKSLNGKPVPADYEVTFMLDENFRATGFGGCNYWSSTIYPQAGQKIASGPPAITRKQCDAARNATERAFLIGVHSGPDWDIEGPELIFKSKAGVLRFDRAL